MNNIDVDQINVIFLLSFSSSCKCFLLIVSMFFLLFWIFLSIILDFETLLLSVFVEKTIQKIFCVETVMKWKFAFVAIVIDFLLILLNEFAILNRNAKKIIQNEQNSFVKKSFNDVEQQRFDAFSSSLSFNASKSNDQMNLDFPDNFFVCSIEQRTTLIRIWCEFCCKSHDEVIQCKQQQHRYIVSFDR